MEDYPTYGKYGRLERGPSVVDQKFPVLRDEELECEKLFYPKNILLEPHFSSEAESFKFGAACFCGFLHDTIAVEHNIVIPAISAVSCLQIRIPSEALEDLYQLVTDEGHHAAQARIYLTSICRRYGLRYQETTGALPLFMRRLDEIKSGLNNPIDRNLCDIIGGIVTETRISIELGEFARNRDLIGSVRELCRSHQADEAIHATQFRALGEWMWSQLSEEKRALTASLYANVIIVRSLPDTNRIGFFLEQATKMSRNTCAKIVKSVYTSDVLESEMLVIARPTIRFLESIGVTEMSSFEDAYNRFNFN